MEVGADQLEVVGADERRAPGDQLVEDDADRVQVAARIGRLALEPLGRQVGQRADDVAAGDAKIGKIYEGTSFMQLMTIGKILLG